MDTLPLAAIVFIGAHLGISGTPLRRLMVGRIGEGPYRGLFSLVALGSIIWLVRAYAAAPLEPLWDVVWLRFFPLAVMPLALALLVAGLTAPNPSLAGQEGRFSGAIEARGILRVTRHPVQMAIALWAVAHLLANGDTASVWFFGALGTLSVAGSVSLDHKKAGEIGERWRAFAATTSVMPFGAIAAGRNALRLGEIGWWRIGLALAIYAILIAAHPYLIGVRAY